MAAVVSRTTPGFVIILVYVDDWMNEILDDGENITHVLYYRLNM